jgi:hypothetical protein
MITIQNLEIRVEVAGDESEQAFARLFNKYIKQWAALAQQQQQAEAESRRERSLTNTRLPGRSF